MNDLRTFFNAIASKRRRFVRINGYYYRDLQKLLHFAIPQDASVIELGCGIGNVIASLPNTRKTGIDFSPAMLEEARRNDTGGTNYHIDDIDNLAHAESYDAVLLLDTLNSLRDVQSALAGIRVKLCHDRTRVIITHYNHLWGPLLRFGEFFGIKTPMPPQSWLSRADVRTLLSLANFEVITEGQRLLFPFFFPLLSWFFNTCLIRLPLLRRLCLVQYAVARPRPFGRKEYSVSIVVPARNEAGTIEKICTSIPRFGLSQEILFVEGGSTDATWDVMQEAAVRHGKERSIRCLRQPGKGKADAVWTGFTEATGDVLMILDADCTVDPSELPKFYEAIAMGVGECINGSRLVYPMERGAMQKLNTLANWSFGILFSLVTGQKIRDTLCGTKVLLRSDYRRMDGCLEGKDPFGDFDILFGAARLMLRIVDLPVHYGARTYGRTNIQRFRHGWRLLMLFLPSARSFLSSL